MSTQKTCPQCGASFDKRANKMYCSSACKLRAFRQKPNNESDEPTPFAAPLSEATDEARSRARRSSSHSSADVRALKVQAEMRKAELAHALEVEKLRLAGEERAREQAREAAQRAANPAPVTAPVLTIAERYQATQAEAKARERQQRDEELDRRYEKLVANFLDLEAERLPARAFINLMNDLKAHEVNYRQHSGLQEQAPTTKERLNFLDEMQNVLRGTVRGIEQQMTPFFGIKAGGFELKKKWRAALRDTLLA